MTVNDLVSKQFAAFNRHDVTALSTAYAPTARVEDPQYPEPLQGTNAIQQDFTDFLAAFPDLQIELVRMITNGTSYAVEATMTATHLGPLNTPTGQVVPATNKRVSANLAVFGDLDSSNQITVEHRYYDLAGILDQIGILS